MAERLSKVAREFNVGINTLIEFLRNKGEEISSNPNTKLTDEQYAVLAKQFSSDGEVKRESNKVDLKNSRKEKMVVAIDETEQPVFKSVKETVAERGPKVLGKIDLNPKPKQVVTSAPAPKAEVVEKVQVVEKPAVEKYDDSDSSSVNQVKVIGTIDLDALNQRTRPPKKSKQEKEKARREQMKARQAAPAPAQKHSNNNSNSEQAPSHSDKKKKKVVHGEKVNVDAVVSSKEGGNKEKHKVNKGDNFTRNEDSKRKLGKLKKKKNEKIEFTGEDIDRQIKDTFSMLGSRGKSQSSKHRRDKRDAFRQQLQEELENQAAENKTLKLTEFVTVSELATMMNLGVNQIISACMSLGLFVSINQRLDADTINVVAEEFGFAVEFVSASIQEAIEEEVDTEENMMPRPPIVTVMGHVDHGKTSLLDYIRKANVIAGEAGGITQHIGAYGVTLEDGRRVTFLDTPGHEAFTAMRARGAQVTDIAIIIVAADDSVMPQTVEAINHASAAGVPIVFAINKIDKPGANPEKIREHLAKMNYLVEDWGGKYQCQEIAAKSGLNVDELLEKVLLEAEMLELKANPNKNAVGSIIESSLDKGRGYVATVLVQSGTLKVGDVILAGQYYGHVKAMFNERGQRMEKAGPSEPALILGLNGAPQAGDKFNVMSEEREARDIANKREQLQREQGLRTQKHITLEEIGRRIAVGNFQELNIIVKGDVDGSIEALSDSLIKLSTDEIQVNVIHKAVGQISEGDVMLAAASNAIIVGFQVRPSMNAKKVAEKEQIDIRLYSVIYQAIEELKSAMEGMLSPDIKEEDIATVEVMNTFNISKVGTIAGCVVRDGKIVRGCKVRLVRDGIVVYTGELGSLKRVKDDVKEVNKGFECGLSIANYNDIKVGDFIEAYQEVEVKKTLS